MHEIYENCPDIRNTSSKFPEFRKYPEKWHVLEGDRHKKITHNDDLLVVFPDFISTVFFMA